MTDLHAKLRFDHAIILVKNLKKAVRHYQRLGFHVVPGGELKGGAQNAIVPFEDGTYLELFSVGGFLLTLAKMFKTIGKLDVMSKGRGPMESRFIPHFARGEGIIEYALFTEDLEKQLDLIRKRGLDILGPIEGNRIQADGTKLEFQWGLSHPHLPFLITDRTSRSLRVPVEKAGMHENGSKGIKELIMAVRDLQEASRRYSDLIGADWETIGPCKNKFTLGSTAIILVGPGESRDVQKYLGQYGDRPFAIGLRTNDKSCAGEMNQSLAGGARIHLML